MKYKWKSLLDSIEQSMLNDPNNDYIFKLFPEKPKTIFYPPAEVSDIEALESRSQMTLPTSYKEFLLITNGLKILSTTYWNIYSTNEVKFLKECQPHLVKIWSDQDFDASDDEYFIYGEKQDSTSLRGHYMKSCIAVSGWGDSAILFLNPEIKFGDEWEAWAFANWYPGAYRFKSFWDLVNSEFQSYIEMKQNI